MGSLYKRKDHDPRKATWYATYIDGSGRRRRRSTGTTSKSAVAQILARWESDAAVRRHGVIDMQAERLSEQNKRPLKDHTKEFIASLKSAGRSKTHIDRTEQALDRLVKFGEWQMLSDITAESVERYGSELQPKWSARTVQRYLRTAKQFTRWAHRTGRIRSDPLISVRPPNPETDRRLERRALLYEEWPHLRDATLDRGLQFRMPAEQRVLLYELAIQTGLRASEISSLTPGKLLLKNAPPYILLPAVQTKSKQQARQYVTVDLAERLREHMSRRPPAAPLFDLPRLDDLADMIRADLAAAREKWVEEARDAVQEAAPRDRGEAAKQAELREASDFLLAVDHENRRIDFHSLRHTCGTWLAMRGENPKTIQTIMRHSTITLTMDRYGHLFPDVAATAVAGFHDCFVRERSRDFFYSQTVQMSPRQSA